MAAPTQADSAYAALHDDILSCRLGPGAKIPINETAVKYGLSPGAVREALSRLSAERMAVATAQKGYSVAEVSAEELRDLTRARIVIEQWCLREAARMKAGVSKSGSPAPRSMISRPEARNALALWETAIVAAYHRLHRLPQAAAGETRRVDPRWAAAHTTFHEALASGCGSPWMLSLRSTLYAQTERYRHLSHAIARQDRDVDSEHKGILDACLARDADSAAARIAAHLTKTSQIVLNSPYLRGRGGEAE